ncbi:MAG TPA: hypothetical protein VJQ57_03040, partial [Acidimicrobiia bacterium]|nr:hypothetical protein [Acidimicrobiia bacterium]
MYGGLGIDLHPHPVDGDMVVIPTEGDEVVGVMAPTPGARMDVVDLQAVTAPTATDPTHTHVPCHHQGPDGGRNRLPQIGVVKAVELGGDHSHLPPTEDLG